MKKSVIVRRHGRPIVVHHAHDVRDDALILDYNFPSQFVRQSIAFIFLSKDTPL